MANLLSSSLLSLLILSSLSLSLSCSDADLTGGRTFHKCLDLPQLGASIHWTHLSDGTASFAFKVKTSGWAAWGPNPTKSGMVGTQAFIARPNATGVSVFTQDLTAYKIVLSPGEISVAYSDLSAEAVNGNYIIYVNIVLPKDATSIRHSWNTGAIRTDGGLAAHPFTPEHESSFGKLELGPKVSHGSPPSAPAPAPRGPASAPGPKAPPSKAPVGAPTSAPGAPRSSPGAPRSAAGAPPPKPNGAVGVKAGFMSSLLLLVGVFLF